ncbi:MAG TPA: MFS transporter [Longimicrobium sp.]|nr:MFS transporter [Longimicrobium sp.]
MADEGARRQSALRVLGRRNFLPYFIGNLLSNCGTWFQNIAQSLLIYRLTGSAFMVGVVNFAQFAGVVLLAPWTGSAADRYDRKRLIVLTQVGSMLVVGALAVLAATGADTVPVVLALALLLGLITAFVTPALQAILPSLVSREDMGAAIAMNSVTFNLSRAVGPVLGALIVARLGIAWAFALNAGSYAALVIGILLVHPRAQPPRPARRPRLRESLRLVRDDRELALLLAAVAAVSITMDPVNTLGPVFATQLFHRPDTVAGVLIGAFGAGAVVASFFPAAHPGTPLSRVGVLIAVMAAGMAAFAFAPGFGVALGVLAVAGFGYLSGQTRATALLQFRVGDEQRGRIMALWSVAFLGSRPIASLLDGALATWLGPRVTTLAMTLPAVAAATALILHGDGRRKRPEETPPRE